MAVDPTSQEAGLFRKIAEVMGEVGYLQKRGVNNFQNYKYATEADIVEAVREKLAERHVALIPGVPSITERPYTTSKGKDSVVTTAQMTFTFCDGDTGAMFRTEWAGQGDDPADKGLYSAMTGALKYFLMKTFLIPTGNDPEANEQTDKRAADRVNGSDEPVTADAPQQTERAATAKQRGLINARAAEKGLGERELLNVIRAVAGQEPVDYYDPSRAQQALNRNLDRLPARMVTPIIEALGQIDTPTVGAEVPA